MIQHVPYPFTVRPLDGGADAGYVVEFPDLPGCTADGKTVEGAIDRAVTAMRRWIDTMRAEGRPIPEPNEPENGVRPIWEIAEEIARTVPDEEWRKLPTDPATNYKHYLYGARKSSE